MKLFQLKPCIGMHHAIEPLTIRGAFTILIPIGKIIPALQFNSGIAG
jgi:hypothetical protein